MKHPIEKYNVQQAQVLASLPEGQRDYMARMFRIGNATYCYYNRAKELAVFRVNCKSGTILSPSMHNELYYK